MLKRIEAKNFQCHKSTNIELAEGVNYIIGDSGTGKTSIFQRLPKWLFFNISPKNLIRHGQKEVQGKAVFSNGTIVEKTKGTKGIQMKLNGEKFEAVGRYVPDEIKEVINLTENNFNNNGRLLLNIRPGDRAKFINKLINLEIIDKASKEANKDIIKIKTRLKHKEEEIKKTKEELKKIAWIHYAEGTLAVLTEIVNKTREVDRKIRKTEEILKEREEILSDIRTLEKNYPPIEQIENMVGLAEKIEDIEQAINAIENLLAEEVSITEEMKNIERMYKMYKKQLIEEFPDICPLCNQEVKNKKGVL